MRMYVSFKQHFLWKLEVVKDPFPLKCYIVEKKNQCTRVYDWERLWSVMKIKIILGIRKQRNICGREGLYIVWWTLLSSVWICSLAFGCKLYDGDFVYCIWVRMPVCIFSLTFLSLWNSPSNLLPSPYPLQLSW